MMVPVPIACAAPGLISAAVFVRFTSDSSLSANGCSAADCAGNTGAPVAMLGTHHSGRRPLGK